MSWPKGKSCPEETKEKLRVAGKKYYLENPDKREIQRKNTTLNNPMHNSIIKEKWLNKVKSEEWREKMTVIRNEPVMKKIIDNAIKIALNTPSGRKKQKLNRAKLIVPLQDTSIEIKIQNFLKELNIEFITHFYIKEINNSYQCDIFIPSKNMIIECDGDYWHGNLNIFPILNEMQIEQRERDTLRTKELLEKGFNIIRLWESAIKKIDLKTFQTKIIEVNN